MGDGAPVPDMNVDFGPVTFFTDPNSEGKFFKKATVDGRWVGKNITPEDQPFLINEADMAAHSFVHIPNYKVVHTSSTDMVNTPGYCVMRKPVFKDGEFFMDIRKEEVWGKHDKVYQEEYKWVFSPVFRDELKAAGITSMENITEYDFAMRVGEVMRGIYSDEDKYRKFVETKRYAEVATIGSPKNGVVSNLGELVFDQTKGKSKFPLNDVTRAKTTVQIERASQLTILPKWVCKQLKFPLNSTLKDVSNKCFDDMTPLYHLGRATAIGSMAMKGTFGIDNSSRRQRAVADLMKQGGKGAPKPTEQEIMREIMKLVYSDFNFKVDAMCKPDSDGKIPEHLIISETPPDLFYVKFNLFVNNYEKNVKHVTKSDGEIVKNLVEVCNGTNKKWSPVNLKRYTEERGIAEIPTLYDVRLQSDSWFIVLTEFSFFNGNKMGIKLVGGKGVIADDPFNLPKKNEGKSLVPNEDDAGDDMLAATASWSSKKRKLGSICDMNDSDGDEM